MLLEKPYWVSGLTSILSIDIEPRGGTRFVTSHEDSRIRIWSLQVLSNLNQVSSHETGTSSQTETAHETTTTPTNTLQNLASIERLGRLASRSDGRVAGSSTVIGFGTTDAGLYTRSFLCDMKMVLKCKYIFEVLYLIFARFCESPLFFLLKLLTFQLLTNFFGSTQCVP